MLSYSRWRTLKKEKKQKNITLLVLQISVYVFVPQPDFYIRHSSVHSTLRTDRKIPPDDFDGNKHLDTRGLFPPSAILLKWKCHGSCTVDCKSKERHSKWKAFWSLIFRLMRLPILLFSLIFNVSLPYTTHECNYNIILNYVTFYFVSNKEKTHLFRKKSENYITTREGERWSTYFIQKKSINNAKSALLVKILIYKRIFDILT